MQLRDIQLGQIFKFRDDHQAFLRISGRNWEPLIVTIPGFHARAISSLDAEVDLLNFEEAHMLVHTELMKDLKP